MRLPKSILWWVETSQFTLCTLYFLKVLLPTLLTIRFNGSMMMVKCFVFVIFTCSKTCKINLTDAFSDT